jgi:general secretion pathway protein L
MPSLPTSDKHVRFVSPGTSGLWRDLVTAWRGMMNWPIVSWMRPKLSVRLALPNGSYALSRDMHTQPLQDEKLAQSARYEAVLMPENLLLRQTVDLPKLKTQELEAALALQVQMLSPFAPDDGIWIHEIPRHGSNNLRIPVVLASRKLITQHLTAVYPRLTVAAPEVWVTRANGSGFMLLPGFGEARRQRQTKVWGWVSATLALLGLAVLIATAVSPSIQLYLRSLQANHAMAALQQRAKPILAQRESLVKATEQLTSLVELSGKSIAPLPTLKLITDALPDDTSLLSLQIQGLKVRISGQTVNASVLMKQLGATSGLRDVKAPTPATKPLGAPRESFTIEFTLDPTQLRPAP